MSRVHFMIIPQGVILFLQRCAAKKWTMWAKAIAGHLSIHHQILFLKLLLLSLTAEWIVTKFGVRH